MPSDPTVAIHCDHLVLAEQLMCGVPVEPGPEVTGMGLWRKRTVKRTASTFNAAPVAEFVFMIRHPETTDRLCDGCVAQIRRYAGMMDADRESLAMLVTFLRGIGAPSECEIIANGVLAIERMLETSVPIG